jgi:lipopolysaccharide biosynthesis glycosyltransferase
MPEHPKAKEAATLLLVKFPLTFIAHAVDEISNAAVIHYNGNMKPWVDIAMNQYKNL